MAVPPTGWLRSLTLFGSELAQGFLHLLYPGICFICDASLPPATGGICKSCQAALTTDAHPTCPHCAGTIGPFTHTADGCPQCRGESFQFERVIRMGFYEGLRREVVLKLKHAGQEGLAEVLGSLWAQYAEAQFRELQGQVIIPIPLYWSKRWLRGYNHSEALAYGLAAQLRLPCRPAWLRRIRNTPKQTQQSPTSRRTNMKGAFQAVRRPGLAGKTVLLIDDVLTTGSTANEAARALRSAGAARVVVAVLARSHP